VQQQLVLWQRHLGLLRVLHQFCRPRVWCHLFLMEVGSDAKSVLKLNCLAGC
jgi:hypothetical protein